MVNATFQRTIGTLENLHRRKTPTYNSTANYNTIEDREANKTFSHMQTLKHALLGTPVNKISRDIKNIAMLRYCGFGSRPAQESKYHSKEGHTDVLLSQCP